MNFCNIDYLVAKAFTGEGECLRFPSVCVCVCVRACVSRNFQFLFYRKKSITIAEQ